MDEFVRDQAGDEFVPKPPSAWDRPSPIPFPELRIAAPIAFVVGLAVTTLCALAVPTALDVFAERGAHGVYVIADEPTCGPDRCRSHLGTFTSDDRTVVRSGVRLAGSPLKSVVQSGRVRAFDVGDPTEVYLEGDSGQPRAVLPFFFGIPGVIALVFGLGYLVRELWRKLGGTRRQ
ncbi:hypothetical protein [Lentzea aerocolonigenes]|uniref:hypothetical protein n=1 Tax=Lentzea aerocolonigenes TaxID=68170 RepID=UPI000A3E7610|nr:hypothetical protein [Lentzea aerocolonigenes]